MSDILSIYVLKKFSALQTNTLIHFGRLVSFVGVAAIISSVTSFSRTFFRLEEAKHYFGQMGSDKNEHSEFAEYLLAIQSSCLIFNYLFKLTSALSWLDLLQRLISINFYL